MNDIKTEGEPQPVPAKPRPKRSEKELEAIKEAQERISIFGNKYPESMPHDWTKVKLYDSVSWVYAPKEGTKFSQSYFICVLQGHYFPRADVGRRDDGEYVDTKHLPEGWMACPISGQYFAKNSGAAVKYKIGGPSTVICYSAFRSKFRQCDKSGDAFPRDDIVKVQHPDYAWMHKHYAKEEGLAQCHNCGTWKNKEFVQVYSEVSTHPICTACADKMLYQNIILPHDAKGYPAAIATKFTRYGHVVKDGLVYATNKPEEYTKPRKFGVEVETEFSMPLAQKAGITRKKLAYHVKKALGDDFVIIKEDGTLVMNGKYSDIGEKGELYAGFEVVSAPADISAHAARWPKLTACEYYPMLRAWDTETCGFHVHVSRDALSDYQIGCMLAFINHKNNKKFVEVVAGRSEKKFTRYVPKDVSDVLHPEKVINPDEERQRDRARRVALNLCNQNTVEFRIFRGTINPKHILRNIEFCDAVCDFCAPCTRSLKEFEHPRFFVEFVNQNRKRWKFLAEWMVLHNLIKLKPFTEKANKDKMTLKPHTVEEGEDKTDDGLKKIKAEPTPVQTIAAGQIVAGTIKASGVAVGDFVDKMKNPIPTWDYEDYISIIDKPFKPFKPKKASQQANNEDNF